MTRTEFLRDQTITGKNKVARMPMPRDWSTADADTGLAQRKMLALRMIFEEMPVYIGEQELVVGTRTLFGMADGNEDGSDNFAYGLNAHPKYVNEADTDYFGFDDHGLNVTHFTPDYGIILEKGVDGVIGDARESMKQPGLSRVQSEWLEAVILGYESIATLITRYAKAAAEMASREDDPARQEELETIARTCQTVAAKPAESFREAIQLLWFTHLATTIESMLFINYGRLDQVLFPYLKDTPVEEAQQLVECLLLKMYDQADIKTTYLNKFEGQLNLTLGGIDTEGNDAVNPVTFMFIDGIEKTRLPEPQLSVRVHSKNPPEFLTRMSELTVKGLNMISYYNDDLFIDSLVRAGLKPELARDYSFDLCQDLLVAGYGDYFFSGQTQTIHLLMDYLSEVNDDISYEDFLQSFKDRIAAQIKNQITRFNATHKAFLAYRDGNPETFFAELEKGNIDSNLRQRSLMTPLPILSALYHTAIEKASDVVFHDLPDPNIGYLVGTPTETINALAAIKKHVFDLKTYRLSEVYEACEADYTGEGQDVMRSKLWNAPKWGNDDDYVDSIAKDILEFACKEIVKYPAVTGGRHMAGIHQAHPVPTGKRLMATPEGRLQGKPTSVTLTPASGAMNNGPTAALLSAAKIDYTTYQWNFCIMINYFASAFKGNEGAPIFEQLIKSYFAAGGAQHQPNVLDVADLRKAQENPDLYKDLIVRLWGVSAHFVDLPRELQDEMIARFE